MEKSNFRVYYGVCIRLSAVDRIQDVCFSGRISAGGAACRYSFIRSRNDRDVRNRVKGLVG